MSRVKTTASGRETKPNSRTHNVLIEKRKKSQKMSQAFPVIVNIEIKQEEVPAQRIFNCGFCNQTFRTKKDLKDHKQRHQNVKEARVKKSDLTTVYVPHQPKFQCEYCFKGFDQSHRLKQHEISHREPIFACDQCDKKFKCQYRLKYHKNEHIPGSEEQCNVCLKIFPTLIRLQQHQIMHNDKIYQCQSCDKRFKCKYRLRYHEMNHYHKAYECPLCTKRFALPSRLAQHLSTHDDNTPSFSCDVCAKTFKNKYRLKYHRNEHDKIKEEVN